MKVVCQLPQVKRKSESRPSQCPHCKGKIFRRRGRVKRRIRDTKVRSMEVVRYKCAQCRRTFRYYPAGVGRFLRFKEKLV